MLLNKSVTEDTVKYFHECRASCDIPLIYVLLWVEFRKIDRLEDHHQTINVSEWDEKDQFEVCWVVQNRNGTYFYYP